MPINYQALYNNPTSVSKISKEDLQLKYQDLNEQYGYFLEASDLSAFERFYNFFNTVKEDEDLNAAEDEICLRAYQATVLFGGVAPYYACRTLQRIINEHYSKSTNPVHDVFAAVHLPVKVNHLNLEYWRKWINGPQSKKAIQLFGVAAELAKKNGSLDGYTVQITSVPINIKNAKTGVIYLTKSKSDPDKIGFIFKNETGNLVYGKLEEHELDAYAEIAHAVRSTPPGIVTSAHERMVMTTLQQKLPDVRREISFKELGVLATKLRYKNFDQAPELAQLCHQYRCSEDVFNKCLALLSQQKTRDNLPQIHIDGAAINQQGYQLVKLPIDDPRALILGMITNCCQSIGGITEACVIDGWTLENNGFYVLLKTKKKTVENPPVFLQENPQKLNYQDYEIVGQGYAWLGTLGNLVFDSWENLRPGTDDAVSVDFLRDFAKKVIHATEYSIFRVLIGAGGKTPNALGPQKTPDPEKIREGYQYSDSDDQYELDTLSAEQKARWIELITASATNVVDFSEEDKTNLVQFPLPAIKYPAMLKEYSQDRTMLGGLKCALNSKPSDRKEIMHGLMGLYQLYPIEQAKNTLRYMAVLDASHSKADEHSEPMDTGYDEIQLVHTDNFIAKTIFFAKLLHKPANMPYTSLSTELMNVLGQPLGAEERSSIINAIEKITPLTHFAIDSNLTKILECMPKEDRYAFFVMYKEANPGFIMTAFIFGQILEVMTPEQQLFFYNEYHNELNTMIEDAFDFPQVLKHLPLALRAEVYEICKNRLPAMIRHSFDFTPVMKYLTVDQRTAVYETSKHKLSGIIKGLYDFTSILEPLNQMQRTEVFEAYREKLPGNIKNTSDLVSVIKHLTLEQSRWLCEMTKATLSPIELTKLLQDETLERSRMICDVYKSKFPEIVRSLSDFKNILKQLKPEQCRLICIVYKHELSGLITTYNNFDNAMDGLSSDKYAIVRGVLYDKLGSSVQAISGYLHLFRELPVEKKIIIYEDNHERFLTQIKTLDEFKKVFFMIPPEIRAHFYDVYKSKLFSDIQLTADDFLEILEFLPQEKRIDFYESCKNKLPIFNGVYWLKQILKHVPSEHSKIIVDDFKKKLPELFESAFEFNGAVEKLLPEQSIIIFEAYQDSLLDSIKNASYFKWMLEYLPAEHRTIVYNRCKENLSELLLEANDFWSIMNYLTPEQRNEVYETNKHKLPDLIHSGYDFSNIIRFLNDEQRAEIYELFKDQLIDRVEKPDNFSTIVNYLSPEQRTYIYEACKNKLSLLIKNGWDYKNSVQYLNNEQSMEVYTACKTALIARGLRVAYDFRSELLRFLKPEDYATVFNDFKAKLPEILNMGSSSLGYILLHDDKTLLSLEEQRAIYFACKDHLLGLIDNAKNFNSLLGYFDPVLRTDIYEACKHKLPEFINESEDFNYVLSKLPPEQRTEVYEWCKDDLASLISGDGYAFDRVMQYLNTEQRTEVYESTKDELFSMISCSDVFMCVLKCLTPAQRTALFYECKNKSLDFATFIMRPYDFYYISEHLTREESRFVYETCKTKLFSMVTEGKGFSGLLHIQSLLNIHDADGFIQASEPFLLEMSELEKFLSDERLTAELKANVSRQLYESLSRCYKEIRLSPFHHSLIEQHSPIKVEVSSSDFKLRRLMAEFKLAFAVGNEEDIRFYFKRFLNEKHIIQPLVEALSTLEGEHLLLLNAALNLNLPEDVQKIQSATVKEAIYSKAVYEKDLFARYRFLYHAPALEEDVDDLIMQLDAIALDPRKQ